MKVGFSGPFFFCMWIVPTSKEMEKTFFGNLSTTLVPSVFLQLSHQLGVTIYMPKMDPKNKKTKQTLNTENTVLLLNN